MISERSTVTTVMPEACKSFSLKRMVWNAPVRAPIEPMRAFLSPHAHGICARNVEVGGEFLAIDIAGVTGRIGEGTPY